MPKASAHTNKRPGRATVKARVRAPNAAFAHLTSIPSGLWKHTRAVISAPLRGHAVGAVIPAATVVLSLLLLVALFLPEPTDMPPHVPKEPQRAARATKTTSAKPPPEAFPMIPREAFAAPRLQTSLGRTDRPDNKQSNTIRALQVDLKGFGLFKEPITGAFDKPTRKSLQELALLAGEPVTDAETGAAAMRMVKARAEQMLWLLGSFPFGKYLPSWVLASVTSDDTDTLFQAFSGNANKGRTFFTVPLSAPGLTVHARLFPDKPDQPAWPACYGFSAIFERPPFQHHVISRACRNQDGVHWAISD